MTNDGLVAFNQASGLQGTQLVPDLAVSLPTPTDGGRTYTFRLRPNIRYSNGSPSGRPTSAPRSSATIKIGKFAAPYFYEGIVGANRCERNPKRCDLSRGIVADDKTRTVTFHLVAPDPSSSTSWRCPSRTSCRGATALHAQLPCRQRGRT